MLNIFAANIIAVLHFLFIIFMIATPFVTKSVGLLFLHSIFVPFLIFHWEVNSDVCCLTILEKYLRKLNTKKEEEDNSFTYNLINPIFNFTDKNKAKENINNLSYTILIFCGAISLVKLMYGYKTKQLTSPFDLFFIDKKLK